MLSRNEFVKIWEPMQIDPDDMNEPIWAYEVHCGVKSQYFVCVTPIHRNTLMSEYFEWCEKHLNNKALCYSSDYNNNKEWWGFTNKDDLLWWLLKWGN